jgi:hypothetical protein
LPNYLATMATGCQAYLPATFQSYGFLLLTQRHIDQKSSLQPDMLQDILTAYSTAP